MPAPTRVTRLAERAAYDRAALDPILDEAYVAHVDGLVVARSAFHSSMNYRSAAVHGVARVVDDPQEKVRLLDAVIDHLLPGRRAELRAMDAGELAATQVIALPLVRFSVKRRSGGPSDAPDDVRPDVWGGVIPLAVTKGVAEPDARTAPGVAPPACATA